MKKLFVCFLVGVINYSCVTAQNTELLPTQYVFNCDKEEAQEIIENPSFFAEVTSVTIEGSGTSADWNKLLKTLSKLPKLEEVRFESNDLTELPKAIKHLWFLTCIHISDHEDFNLNTLPKSLRKNTSLMELSFEVANINDLPANIAEMSQLTQLNLVNPELTSNDETKTIAFQIPIFYKNNGAVERKLNAEMLTWKESPEERQERLAGHLKIQDSSRPMTEAPTLFEKQWNSFQPPIEELEVQKSYYTTNTANCDTLVYRRSGTKLIIPPSAFVDKEGKVVESNVSIDYREFRDAIDFIFSGIPMSFQENDSTYSFFSSAGMFEVNASVNGEEVYLAEGKNIEIKFASTDSTEQYNFYAFNDSTGGWEETGNAPLDRTKKVLESYLSPAVQFYLKNQIVNENYFDTTLFAARFLSPTHQYIHDKVRGPKKLKERFRHSGNIKPSKTLRLRKVRKTREGDVVFDLQTHRSLHPEMSVASRVSWRLEEPLNTKEFKKQFCYKNKFNDIRLEESGGTYKFILKTDSAHRTISVTPVTVFKTKNGRKYEPAKLNYKVYKKSLANREKQIDKPIRRYIKDTSKRQKIARNKAFQSVRILMNEREILMPKKSFEKYALALQNSADTLYSTSEANEDNFQRTLKITVLGIHNCDILRSFEQPDNVLVNFRSENDSMLYAQNTYVIIPDLNSAISFPVKGTGQVQRITVDRKNGCLILVFDKNGNYYLASKQEVVSLFASSTLKRSLQLKSIGDKSSSLAEIRSAVGL